MILLLFILIPVAWGFSFSECNVTRSCWHHPSSCSATNPSDCLSGVEWRVDPDGLWIQIETQTRDLDPTRPFWAAVGFSFNQRMGDDTVFECIVSPSTAMRVQLSFNDETFNHVLPQATSVLLNNTAVGYNNGMLLCSATIMFDNYNQIDWNMAAPFRVHNLESQPFHLLFARGSADSYTFEKDIHSVNDGAQFPWMSDEKVEFCRTNCTGPTYVYLNEMRQTYYVSRYWRYRIAVLHGVALMTAWWILGSSAILIARYFKPLFPRQKLCGTAVWFQLHRDLNIIALVLQILAVIFIYYQAGWVWYECSYLCTSDDFSKKMHAITGFFATCLALSQPIFAFFRPSPHSKYRIFFNWLHWFVGMAAWSFASAAIILAIPMGKTGLNRVYGHIPNYVMGGYVIFFLCCNIVLEMISTCRFDYDKVGVQPHRFLIGPSGVSLSDPSKSSSPESDAPPPRRSSLRLFIFFLHLIVAFAVVITITTMLVAILLSHSP
ncbi:hypothetical protein WR25_21162 [Diploscapter pachys]|uniref:Cytochrome b561 domain-containing protein n=1 Tax=Diploscapter pachys TaxID=2018661 RepID=A0A2A2L9R9_9BILA|nr:hypothetical protein WR25_21162 [Diploscapter pachys]